MIVPSQKKIYHSFLLSGALDEKYLLKLREEPNETVNDAWKI